MSSILEVTLFILATAAIIACNDWLGRFPKPTRERIVTAATLVICVTILIGLFAVPSVSTNCIGRRHHDVSGEVFIPAVQGSESTGR